MIRIFCLAIIFVCFSSPVAWCGDIEDLQAAVLDEYNAFARGDCKTMVSIRTDPHVQSLLSKLDSGYGNLDSMQAESPQSVPGVGRQKPLKQAFWGNRSLTEGGLRRAA